MSLHIFFDALIDDNNRKVINITQHNTIQYNRIQYRTIIFLLKSQNLCIATIRFPTFCVSKGYFSYYVLVLHNIILELVIFY
jgi:hypothetical protein